MSIKEKEINFFNNWAANYDRIIHNRNDFPFIRFQNLLQLIAERIQSGKVLDAGCGTADIVKYLDMEKCSYCGVDFAAKMLERAKKKFPDISTKQLDIQDINIENFGDDRFDYIISNYALHHFTDAEKRSIIDNFMELLNPGGRILIGDISFVNQSSFDTAYQTHTQEWDDSEFYINYENFAANHLIGLKHNFVANSAINGLLQISI